MSLSRLLPLALALLSLPAASLAQAPSCPYLFAGGAPPALRDARLGQRATFLCNDAYAVLASGVTRGALWSAERPTAESLVAARQVSRVDMFHPEERLPPDSQAQLEDYRRSGFDRGHMTPAGDMPDTRAQEQSFSLANMVPQVGVLNRGLWEGIESAVRDMALREGELYVVTGPAFQSRRLQSIGPGGVLVPSSVWKAVYDPRSNGAGVYVCKNIEAPTCATVSVANLVRVVGIDPFPAVPDAVKQVAMPLPPPNHSHNAYAQNRRRPRGAATAW